MMPSIAFCIPPMPLSSQDLEVLKRGKARYVMFVRCTMDRHVLKIRQLERRPVQPREIADFIAEG